MTYRVVFAAPSWRRSTANRHARVLAAQLGASGIDVRVVLVWPSVPGGDDPTFPLPAGVPCDVLNVPKSAIVRPRMAALRAYLCERAPCVFVPGDEPIARAVCPTLPPNIRVVSAVWHDEYADYVGAAQLRNASDVVLCANRHIEERCQRFLGRPPSRIVRIHGHTRTLSAPRVERDQAVLRMMFVGALDDHQRRSSILPEVMAELAARGIDSHLTIFGDGPLTPQLTQQVHARALSGRIRLAGAVSDETLDEAFLAHQVLLLPSQHEGAPSTLVRAMAAGTVPIATMAPGGVREFVTSGHEGLLVTAVEPTLLADAVEQLAKSPRRLDAMSAKARARIARECVSEANHVATVDRLFRVLLACRHGWNRVPAAALDFPHFPLEKAEHSTSQRSIGERLRKRLNAAVRSRQRGDFGARR